MKKNMFNYFNATDVIKVMILSCYHKSKDLIRYTDPSDNHIIQGYMTLAEYMKNVYKLDDGELLENIQTLLNIAMHELHPEEEELEDWEEWEEDVEDDFLI